MKRTLSLVLALVMVLGTFGTVFAAEEELVNDAAEFLEDEGVLLGDEDGDLMLEEDLERRDAVVLLSRLLGVEDEAAEFATTEESPSWEDARTDAYYVPFFAWAQENEYFEGDDEGNFNPREAITAQEFALVLIRALDYEANGHESWEAAFEQAEELGLLEDAEVEEKEAILRGQMAIMIFNALGTEMNDSDETLAEFLGIEMPEEEITELEVVEVYSENLMEIVVELSNADLADEVQLKNPNNYELNDDRDRIIDADLVGDQVILLLEGGIQNSEIDEDADPMVRNRQYTLTIKGIDRDINDEYKFTARDNTIPAIESVEVLGEYGIKVTTSEPVEEPQERDFLIDGRRESMNLEQYGRDLILTPYHNEEFDADAEELEIRELEDYANYKTTPEVFDIEIIEDDEAPEVVNAYFYEDGKEVYVEFDKDIYEDSVKHEDGRNRGNVSFEEGRRTFYAINAAKVDTNKAVYIFEDEWDEDNELLIQGVENHSKVTMDRTTIVPVEIGEASDIAAVLTNNDSMQTLEVGEEVYGIDEDGNEFDYTPGDQIIGDVVYANGEQVDIEFELEFDKDIKAQLANGEEVDPAVPHFYGEDYSNYFTVYEGRVGRAGEARTDAEVTDVRFDSDDDRDVLVVTISDLNINDSYDNFDYILEVEGIIDEDGEEIDRQYLDFEVVMEDEDEFRIEKVRVVLNRNYIDIFIDFLDVEVNRASARDGRNYLFVERTESNDPDKDDLYDVDGEASVENNGETVRLRLDINEDDQAEFFEDYEGLEILQSLRSLDGDRLSGGDLEWDLNGLDADDNGMSYPGNWEAK